MFGFLKYAFYAFVVLVVYVMVEHALLHRNEIRQTIANSVNEAENKVVYEVQNETEEINEEYVQPALRDAME